MPDRAVEFWGNQPKVTRTMHSRVWPSTVQRILVVPRPTGVTTPSEVMEATAVFFTLQVGVEEVPLTFIFTAGSLGLLKVKSVLFRDREEEAALGEAEGAGVDAAPPVIWL